MPFTLMTANTPVVCAHGGQAKPTAPMPRVKVMGQPVVVQSAPHAVAGCANAPGGVPLPCVTVQWLTGATRVTVMGQPVLLINSKGLAAETGTPVTVIPSQPRVKGT